MKKRELQMGSELAELEIRNPLEVQDSEKHLWICNTSRLYLIYV